jgi:hypothetical protein
MVELSISMDSAAFEDASALKALSAEQQEVAMVPLGDNRFMHISLKVDSAETGEGGGLRGSLQNNQRVCLAAFRSSDNVQQGSTRNYYYSSSLNDLIPAGARLIVPVGVSYYIVAYSYNSTSTYPGTTNIEPSNSNDLMWGVSTAKTITLADRTVTINMAHKFTRVRVQVNANVSGVTKLEVPGTVTLENCQKWDLNIRTGAINSAGSVGLRTVSSWTSLSNVSWQSDYQIFYPSPTRVNIGSLTMTVSGVSQPQTYTNRYANFTTTLAAGSNYTLMVDIKDGVTWAKSNIYWNGTELTFDKTGTVAGSENYRGVHFKWGSLVGIEPVNATSSNYVYSVPIYIPNVSAKTWDGTKTLGSTYNYNWDNVPYVYYTNYGSNANFLYDYSSSTSYANHEGDVCKYLTDGEWRMPNSNELGVVSNYGSFVTGTDVDNSNSSTDAIMSGIMYNVPSGAVFLPASDYRETAGVMWIFGVSNLQGGYWSGTCSSNSPDNGARSLLFDENGAVPTGAKGRNYALSVRCVKP